jgi:hypothetical protein
MDGSIIADAKVTTDQDLAQTPVAKGPTPLEGAPRPATGLTRVPGELFGKAPVAGRKLDAGMGLAVARRTVFRPSDHEDFGRVADRVSVGNMSLLGRPLTDGELKERARLRNAIASGALITSGRHLQHGDAGQADRNMELYTNCATAIASFSKFYLLMNGSGVGRAYDDELCVIDWGKAPKLVLALSTEHPDHPLTRADLHRYGSEWGILPWGTSVEDMTNEQLADIAAHRDREFVPSAARAAKQARAEGKKVIVHLVKDSREGWGKALEILKAMAHRGESDSVLVLDFSSVRPRGTPIMGMQGRPASGPLSPMRAFASVRQHVIEPARGRTAEDEMLQPWAQALMVDHYFSVEVQVGGARRAARMATKSWRDKGVHKFIRSKSEGGLWTANHSVTVDAEF